MWSGVCFPSEQFLEFADGDGLSRFGGAVGGEADRLSFSRVVEIGIRLLVVEYAVKEMGDFALERVVGDVAAVGEDARDFEKVVLAGEELWGVQLVVAERALCAVDADIEPVGHLRVEGGCAAPDLAVLEFDVDRNRAGVVGGVATPDLIGTDLLDRAPAEPPQGVHGVTARRLEGGAALFQAAVPFQGPDAVQIIDLHHEDIAKCALLDEVVDGHQQRIPVQHETDDGLDFVLFDRVALFDDVLRRQGRGLFDDDVLSGLRRGNDVWRVHVVRRAYRDDIHVLLREHLRGVGFNRAFQVVQVSIFFGVGAVPAYQGPHLGPFVVLKGLDVFFGHPAASNDGCTKLFHIRSPLYVYPSYLGSEKLEVRHTESS